jgi:hypothetical protein
VRRVKLHTYQTFVKLVTTVLRVQSTHLNTHASQAITNLILDRRLVSLVTQASIVDNKDLVLPLEIALEAIIANLAAHLIPQSHHQLVVYVRKATTARQVQVSNAHVLLEHIAIVLVCQPTPDYVLLVITA